MRRHFASISAAVIVAAVSLAGCSSGGHQKVAAAPKPALSALAAGQQPLGTTALKAMLLTPAEAGTGWTAARPEQTSDDVQLDTRDVAITDGGEACQATADVFAGVPPYGASAMAESLAHNADGTGFAQLITVLKPADAQYVVPHLRDTIRGCDGEVGFIPWSTSFQLGEAKDGGKYVITGVDSPFLGNDSTGFSIVVPGATIGPNGAPATAEVTVVRVGAVIAYYVHTGDATNTALVTAAVAKLKQSQASA